MGKESKDNEPSIKREHPINVLIPEACLDPDGGECEHSKKEIKKEYNPV